MSGKTGKQGVEKNSNLLFDKPASSRPAAYRRQSFLLTTLIFSILVLNLLLMIGMLTINWPVPWGNSELVLHLVSLGWLLLALFFNLAGKYNVSATLVILEISVFIFLASIPVFVFSNIENILFLIFPTLMASILLTMWGSVFIVSVQAIGIALMFIVLPGMSLQDIPAFILTTFSLLALLLAKQRNDIIEARYDELSVFDQRKSNLLDNAPEAIVVFDWEENRIIHINATAEKVFGIERSVLLTYTLADLFDIYKAIGSGFDEELKIMVEGAVLGQKPVLEWEFETETGERLFAEIRSVKMSHEEKLLIRSSILDITDRKLADEHAQFLATHDPVTELPKSSLFEDRLIRAISLARRKAKHLGVLIIDLDNFQNVNEAFSQAIGDQYLKIIADRFKAVLRDSDTIARRGGDEFSIILEGINDPSDIISIAEKMLLTASDPVIFEESEIFITSSIGISVYPMNGTTSQELLKNADSALFHSKSKGKNSFQFFSEELEARALERLSLSGHLKRALERREFCLEYQPQIDVLTGKVIGLEALLRWDHPELGRISPGEFIPLAEDTGLIVPIGEWVIKHVCQQCQLWKNLTRNPIRISINLAEAQLQKKNFVEFVEGVIQENELDPGMIELELTENIVFRNIDHSKELLIALKKLGVRLAVDDFGTGYSTLRLLAEFPFDILKIDKSFAAGVSSDSKDRAIVKGILQIARGLDLEVIAEGVETAEQLSFYQKNQCLLIQGWYYSKAVSEEDVPETIDKVFTYFY
ncbi:MAG: EAL domain-containing protein [Anaerolineaceae bacterium]|nr:EAL domain-containing protein [Anaerolineaceae bacterium]